MKSKGRNVLSQEQKHVVNASQQNNINVIARAGAGKTTTSFAVARRLHATEGKKTLLLVYNKLLKIECRQKIQEKKMSEYFQSESFHSCALFFTPSKSTSKSNTTDFEKMLQDFLAVQKIPSHQSFDCVIFDEVQDMTERFYKFAVHLLNLLAGSLKRKPQCILLGDPFQSVYQYQGSSTKYLLNPDKYFSPYCAFGGRFQSCTLSTSFRLTRSMKTWINSNFSFSSLYHGSSGWWDKKTDYGPPNSTNGQYWQSIWDCGVKSSNRKGRQVTNLEIPKCSSQKEAKQNLNAVTITLRKIIHQYGPGNTAILTWSTDHCNVLKYLQLSLDDFLFYIKPNDISRQESQEILQDKIFCSTVAGFKGAEKDLVIVCHWNSMTEYYTLNPLESSSLNTNPLPVYCNMYVALTRAKKHLCVLSNFYFHSCDWNKHPVTGHEFCDKMATGKKECLKTLPFRTMREGPLFETIRRPKPKTVTKSVSRFMKSRRVPFDPILDYPEDIFHVVDQSILMPLQLEKPETQKKIVLGQYRSTENLYQVFGLMIHHQMEMKISKGKFSQIEWEIYICLISHVEFFPFCACCRWIEKIFCTDKCQKYSTCKIEHMKNKGRKDKVKNKVVAFMQNITARVRLGQKGVHQCWDELYKFSLFRLWYEDDNCIPFRQKLCCAVEPKLSPQQIGLLTKLLKRCWELLTHLAKLYNATSMTAEKCVEVILKAGDESQTDLFCVEKNIKEVRILGRLDCLITTADKKKILVDYKCFGTSSEHWKQLILYNAMCDCKIDSMCLLYPSLGTITSLSLKESGPIHSPRHYFDLFVQSVYAVDPRDFDLRKTSVSQSSLFSNLVVNQADKMPEIIDT